MTARPHTISKTLKRESNIQLCLALLRVHSKYSNRAVTLIQQSCISNTLIEQSPHMAYAIIKKNLKGSRNQNLKGSRNLSDKKL